MSSLTLKEEGNEKFKAGQYEDALACYTSALELSDVKDSEKANLYKNRAMCYLKISKYEEAVRDSTQGTILFQFQHSAASMTWWIRMLTLNPIALKIQEFWLF